MSHQIFPDVLGHCVCNFSCQSTLQQPQQLEQLEWGGMF